MNSNLPITELTPAFELSALADAPRRGSARRYWIYGGLLAFVVLILSGVAVARAFRQMSLRGKLADARASLREFRPDEAVRNLLSLTAQCPESAEAEFLLASAYRRAGRLDQVQPHLKRALELGWDSAEVDRQFCLTYFQAGDFRRSAIEMTDWLQQRATDDEAEEVYEALARGYMAAMLLRQATFVLDGWLQWRPKSAPAHLLMADIAILAGNEQREIDCYRNALSCEPSNYQAQRSLARALVAVNGIDEASKLCKRCLDECPEDLEVLLVLAECHERQGHSGEAQTLLNRVLASQANDRQRSKALTLSGQIALEAKNYDQASRLLHEAVETHPSSLPAVYSLCQVLSRAGHDAEANRYQERFARLKELEEELEDLHSDLLKDPSDADVRARIGEALFEMGSADAGANWLLSALLYKPEHRGAHRRLAQFYDTQGKLELAERHRAIAKVDETREAPVPLMLQSPSRQSR